MKNEKIKILIIVLMFFIFLFIIMPTIVIKMSVAKITNVKFDKYIDFKEINDKKIINIVEAVKYINNIENSELVDVKIDQNIFYGNEVVFSLNIDDSIRDKIVIKYDFQNQNGELNIEQPSIYFEDEGKKDIRIYVYYENEKIKEYNYVIYIIKGYSKQFAESFKINRYRGSLLWK